MSMTEQATHSHSNQSMILLSRLLLVQNVGDPSSSLEFAELRLAVRSISRAEFDELVSLADSNHVIVRGLEVFLSMVREAKDETRADWAHAALAVERARIEMALARLKDVCNAIESDGFQVIVIKSLDHWPDLGSDLDLYTNAKPRDISRLLKMRFEARIAPRSWGDRLARKWNYLMPGLPEAIEIHMGRLGQTGEQVEIASHLVERSRWVFVNSHLFRVPSVSDRLMISTLQRMYRHFYFRLCDIMDSAALLESGEVDYADLLHSASAAGIWEGVATYLAIVADYVKQYRGTAVVLPQFVLSSARFGGGSIYYRREFLRVPIMPESVRLYGQQLAGMMQRWDMHNGIRLSLLPWLATAAAVGQKLTGSDKGIW